MMATVSASRVVEVSDGLDTVRLTGRPDEAGLHLGRDGIEGWYGQPDRKVTLTERQTGDGDFPVRDEDLHFAARTVTIHVVIVSETRADQLEAWNRLARLSHREVTVRVSDAGEETWAAGFALVVPPAAWSEHSSAVTVTVVCTDPRRYGTAHTLFLDAGAAAAGGLVFPVGEPVSFGDAGPASNTGLLLNAGSAPAYPRFEVHGDYPDGVRVMVGGRSVTYTGPITAGAPVLIDCLERAASIGGLDRSQFLGERDFPTVPAGGSIRAAFSPLSGASTGWCVATSRDTYI
jgi:hypothetical protein